MTVGIHIGQLDSGRFCPRSLFACTLLLFVAICAGWAQQDERSVRVAFVYNLTKYVTWPGANQNQDLDLCVIGDSAAGSAIKQLLDGKASEGRTVRVMIQPSEPVSPHCNITYFPRAARDKGHVSPVNATSGAVLTVGEDERFVREGGMVAFVRSGDSIQIEINPDAVKAAGLSISSRLLEIALLIHPGRRG
jgi:preprotein translocase subunit Sec61beta